MHLTGKTRLVELVDVPPHGGRRHTDHLLQLLHRDEGPFEQQVGNSLCGDSYRSHNPPQDSQLT